MKNSIIDALKKVSKKDLKRKALPLPENINPKVKILKTIAKPPHENTSVEEEMWVAGEEEQKQQDAIKNKIKPEVVHEITG